MFNIFKSNNSKRLVKTSTDELFIPVRLYYKIHNKALFVKALNKLKCAEFAEWDKKHFIISYYKEAKKMNLEVFYQDVPPGLYPVTLADCYIKDNYNLCIDLKSLERGIEMIDFLAKYIRPFNIIELTAFAHSNSVTVCKNQEELQAQFELSYDELFDHLSDNTKGWLPRYMKNTGQEHLPSIIDIEELQLDKADSILSDLHEQEKYEYPFAEKMDIHYQRSEHQALLDMLNFRSSIKQKVAIKRFEGFKDYTSVDAINEFLDFAASHKQES